MPRSLSNWMGIARLRTLRPGGLVSLETYQREKVAHRGRVTAQRQRGIAIMSPLDATDRKIVRKNTRNGRKCRQNDRRATRATGPLL